MKKVYQSPRLVSLGEITDLTQGCYGTGNSDSIRIFSFITITFPIGGPS